MLDSLYTYIDNKRNCLSIQIENNVSDYYIEDLEKVQLKILEEIIESKLEEITKEFTESMNEINEIINMSKGSWRSFYEDI